MNYALPGAIYSAILAAEAVYIQKASLSPRKGNIYFYVLKEFQFPENATVTSKYDSVTRMEVMILEQEKHIHHAWNNCVTWLLCKTIFKWVPQKLNSLLLNTQMLTPIDSA